MTKWTVAHYFATLLAALPSRQRLSQSTATAKNTWKRAQTLRLLREWKMRLGAVDAEMSLTL
jgi:hypothetical protein